MAELLVMARSNPDPRGYQRGDVVLAMPDGHEWGRGELDEAVFLIVEVPGDPSEFEHLREEHTPPWSQGQPKIRHLTRRRVFGLQLTLAHRGTRIGDRPVMRRAAFSALIRRKPGL